MHKCKKTFINGKTGQPEFSIEVKCLQEEGWIALRDRDNKAIKSSYLTPDEYKMVKDLIENPKIDKELIEPSRSAVLVDGPKISFSIDRYTKSITFKNIYNSYKLPENLDKLNKTLEHLRKKYL